MDQGAHPRQHAIRIGQLRILRAGRHLPVRILHYFLPNTSQGILDIWPGVISAALAFTALTQIFPIYLRLTQNVNTYGALFGVVWLLLTWFLMIAHILVISTLINAWNLRRRRKKSIRQDIHRPESI